MRDLFNDEGVNFPYRRKRATSLSPDTPVITSSCITCKVILPELYEVLREGCWRIRDVKIWLTVVGLYSRCSFCETLFILYSYFWWYFLWVAYPISNPDKIIVHQAELRWTLFPGLSGPYPSELILCISPQQKSIGSCLSNHSISLLS